MPAQEALLRGVETVKPSLKNTHYQVELGNEPYLDIWMHDTAFMHPARCHLRFLSLVPFFILYCSPRPRRLMTTSSGVGELK